MIDVLAESLQKLTARRGLLAREISTLDEAIAALQRVRDEAPKHGTAAARPGPVSVPPSTSAPTPPLICERVGCGQPVPPMPPQGGRPRRYCSKKCVKKATKERARVAAAPASPVDDEDPTDRAIRMHRELHPMPESASGMRSRAKAAR